MLDHKEYIVWEQEPYRVISRDYIYFIQSNNISYKHYIDICSVNDKILAVLIAIILCSDFHGLPVKHHTKDVYRADLDARFREHLFTFNISEAIDVEFKEVTNE